MKNVQSRYNRCHTDLNGSLQGRCSCSAELSTSMQSISYLGKVLMVCGSACGNDVHNNLNVYVRILCKSGLVLTR